MADFIARILLALLKLLGREYQEVVKNEQIIKEEGARAEAGSKESVSDLTGEDDIDFGTPETPAPIKEGKNVPSTKKASDYLKSRRTRKRP